MFESLMNRMEKENCRLISIDLFSGAGGLATGFKRAGILPIIAVEWNTNTAKTYSRNHNTDIIELDEYLSNENYRKQFTTENPKSVLIHGDINKVTNDIIKTLLAARYGVNSETETVDVVSGGAPCESFSTAGTRTVNDERDGLFGNIVRIARATKTKTTLFENVKGLFSKPRDGKKGGCYKFICDSFENEDADITYRLVSKNPDEVLLNAADYGIPQLRQRLFLVGIRNDLKNIQFTYPEKEYGTESKPYITVWDAISDLPNPKPKEDITEYKEPDTYISENQRKYLSVMRENAGNTLIHQYGTNHIQQRIDLISILKEGEGMNDAIIRLTGEGTIEQYRHLFPKVIYNARNNRLTRNKPSRTVTGHAVEELIHPIYNRPVTVREAARLQSFPDTYYFEGKYNSFYGLKEQTKYEQVGDAIPPLLAYALGKQFRKCLPDHI